MFRAIFKAVFKGMICLRAVGGRDKTFEESSFLINRAIDRLAGASSKVPH